MEVRFFKTSERQLLLDSIDRLWSHNHVYVRKPEVLEHLVLRTPYCAAAAGEDHYSYLGMWDEDREVVGLYGAMPQEMNLFGETYPSLTGTTWIVNKSKHRHIDGLAFEDFLEQTYPHSMYLAIGLSDVAYRIRKALGCYMLEDVPRWIAVNRMQETLDVLLPEDSVRPYLPQLHPVAYTSERYHVAVDAFDATAWDDFYTKRFAPISVGTKRDAKFLHWRYQESPVLKYHVLTVHDGDEIHGLAVVRIEPILGGACRIGRVLEFIAVEAEPSVLLANAVARFDPEVLMWDFYCMSDITAFGLEAVGFRRLPAWMDKTMMPTRFQPVDYEHMKLNAAVWVDERLRDQLTPVNSQQWYVTKGDADQDRAN